MESFDCLKDGLPRFDEGNLVIAVCTAAKMVDDRRMFPKGKHSVFDNTSVLGCWMSFEEVIGKGLLITLSTSS